MAKVRNLMEVEGRIKNLSFYTMEGCDQIIVRTKGGPSKYKVKHDPKFAVVRKNNIEWSGCTQMSKIIFNTLKDLFRLADYPVIGTLNAVCKSIQTQDTESEHGARGLYLTKYGKVLEGFTPNKRRILEQTIQVLPEYTVDRDGMCAQVSFPAIQPEYQLTNVRNLPYFRLIATLGAISDVYLAKNGKSYDSYKGVLPYTRKLQISDWLSTNAPAEPQNFQLKFDDVYKEDFTVNQSLILGIGVEFGKENAIQQIEPVKHSGSARLLKVF
ncbi:MAG: hypothetical protein Q8909_02820 [Bacteroidota bacterium]|nr:hypothetical protein [Bacteroidota bacterium]